MSRILYLESVAGVAGDMFTAAFLDAGLVSPEAIRDVPGLLGAPEVTVEIESAMRAHSRFTHLRVVPPPGAEANTHRHHHYPALVRQLEGSGLEPGAKAFALEVFRLLAEAEAHAHGVPLEKVAFHEVGAIDSVVDVAMAGVCVQAAAADGVLASPVKLGRGKIRIAHGVYPVPPPASARLAMGMPVAPVPEVITREDVELSTPTGLAILRALKPAFVEGWPGGTLRAQGSGAGTMDLGPWPNVFRVSLFEEEAAVRKAGPSGESAPGATAASSPLPYATDRVVELRCNVDDQTGERTGWLLERGLALGALDAWAEPLVGKKGRPAACIVLLTTPEDRDRLVDFLLRHSSSYGVRHAAWDRFKLLRETEVRETARGPVSFSVGKTLAGEVIKEKPEYEDLKRIWEEDPGFQP